MKNLNAAGCDSTITTTLTVNAGIDATMCVYGSVVALAGTPTGGTYSGNGVTGSNFDPATGAGTHVTTYSYTDGNSCSSTDLVTFIVDNCSGINEEILPGVLLYPNPNNGEFTLTGVEVGNTYEVFSAEGKLILTNTVSSSTESVKLPMTATDNYFMSTVNKDGEKGSIQFFVESK